MQILTSLKLFTLDKQINLFVLTYAQFSDSQRYKKKLTNLNLLAKFYFEVLDLKKVVSLWYGKYCTTERIFIDVHQSFDL
jgi:hypothetical protein